MNDNGDVLFVVGHAKFPAETAARHFYGSFTLGVLLERGNGKILEVSSTTLPPYGNQFLRDIILGKKIPEDIKAITEEINLRYVCRNRNTLLAALGDVLKRLREHERRLPRKDE